jgi:hypothetical protein
MKAAEILQGKCFEEFLRMTPLRFHAEPAVLSMTTDPFPESR